MILLVTHRFLGSPGWGKICDVYALARVLLELLALTVDFTSVRSEIRRQTGSSVPWVYC